jgi:hypothetical protein
MSSELGCSLSNILEPVTASPVAGNFRKRGDRESSSVIADLSDDLVMDYE